MPFLETVPPERATGILADLYAEDRESYGFVANHTRSLSLRPGVVAAWRNLQRAIRADMDDRRFELATLAAARALRSSYCALSHGAVLRKHFYDDDQLARIARDFRDAGLAPLDVAIMAFAERIATAAHTVGREQIDALRGHGLEDAEILDVALTAAARAFYSKSLDAVGAEPDARYARLGASLRDVLVVGREIEDVA